MEKTSCSRAGNEPSPNLKFYNLIEKEKRRRPLIGPSLFNCETSIIAKVRFQLYSVQSVTHELMRGEGGVSEEMEMVTMIGTMQGDISPAYDRCVHTAVSSSRHTAHRPLYGLHFHCFLSLI